MVRETDALLVWGGDVLYLSYWMRQSGLADLLPSLSELVYVGVSAGSIAMTPYNCDAEFDLQFVPEGSDQARGRRSRAGIGRFRAVRPPRSRGLRGLDHGQRRTWAAAMPAPTYAIDDQSAVKVSDGKVEVVSEGNWKLFAPGAV